MSIFVVRIREWEAKDRYAIVLLRIDARDLETYSAPNNLVSRSLFSVRG